MQEPAKDFKPFTSQLKRSDDELANFLSEAMSRQQQLTSWKKLLGQEDGALEVADLACSYQSNPQSHYHGQETQGSGNSYRIQHQRVWPGL
jgi:hypothetical protein